MDPSQHNISIINIRNVRFMSHVYIFVLFISDLEKDAKERPILPCGTQPATTTFFSVSKPLFTSFLKCSSAGFLTVQEFKSQRSASSFLFEMETGL